MKTVSPPTEERNTINKKDDGKKRKTSDGLEQDVMKAAKVMSLKFSTCCR